MIENINLGKYTEPSYQETLNRSGWVEYGKDNLFPNYLIDLYNSSAVHHALVDSIAYMIYGQGIQLTGEAQLQIEAWGLNEEIRKACLDLKLQGGYYLQVSYSLDRSYIKSVEHIPFEYIRAGAMQENGTVPYYYHCLDWENYRKVGVTPICSFDVKKKNDHPVQIVAVKPFSIGAIYYPKPDYMGSINWIEIDKQVAIYHNNNLNNGMAPSMAIHWKNGVPPKEERRQIRQDIERQMTGAHNAGKFFMTFSDGADQAPSIEPFDLSQASEQYQFLSEESTAKIMIGHRATSPALFGVKTAGQLGGTEELKTASQLFNSNVIEPYQYLIIDTIKMLLRQNDINTTISLVSNNPMLPTEGADIEQSFTGIQISSAVDIITKVKLGELNATQAVQLLVSMLGFSEEAANNIFKEEIELSSQKKKPFLSEEEGNTWLSYLEAVGEKIDLEEWELIEETKVTDNEEEAKLNQEPVKYFKRYADPDLKSLVDSGLYKVRYRYSRNISDKSRSFCKNMVANSKGGVVYRYEDIIEMGQAGVNSEFSPRGQSTYNIWEWKGGAYCHHYFYRQVYVRKRDKGRFLPNEGLDNDKEISTSEARVAGLPFKDKDLDYDQANTRPIDTPNRGKLK